MIAAATLIGVSTKRRDLLWPSGPRFGLAKAQAEYPPIACIGLARSSLLQAARKKPSKPATLVSV
jgi:hypothetical protein